jgi:hypothetical protein
MTAVTPLFRAFLSGSQSFLYQLLDTNDEG